MPLPYFHHPFRIDDTTLARASVLQGVSKLLGHAEFPDSLRFLAIDSTAFFHAYALLGKAPQRFDDVYYYLATVTSFFRRTKVNGGIRIATDANPDLRRRLSEDLGVGLGCYFMVEVFGVSWATISQIPQNTNLSAKRPDFQGFSLNGNRYLFETKGTTRLTQIEKALSQALKQVKSYPENSEAKLAFVSYLSGDDRFFTSHSFLVDPPALPVTVEPDVDTARQLHFEKVLQFIGLSQLANDYIVLLSRRLTEERRRKRELTRTMSWSERERVNSDLAQLRATLEKNLAQLITHRSTRDNLEFLGRVLEDPSSGIQIFLGVEREVLFRGISYETVERNLN